jgi:hypothetical protein
VRVVMVVAVVFLLVQGVDSLGVEVVGCARGSVVGDLVAGFGNEEEQGDDAGDEEVGEDAIAAGGGHVGRMKGWMAGWMNHEGGLDRQALEAIAPSMGSRMGDILGFVEGEAYGVAFVVYRSSER